MFHVPDRPYDREIAAVDSLRPGDVFVMAVGRSAQIVPWGELLSTATGRGAGLRSVLDGLVRDSGRSGDGTARLLLRPPPLRLVRPRDRRRLRRADRHRRRPLAPGDLVFGDADGVVIVPRGSRKKSSMGWDKVNRKT